MKTNITTTDKKTAIKREECICNQLRNAPPHFTGCKFTCLLSLNFQQQNDYN